MVLIFESKTYESITQRIIFSIFKYGYIAQKYKLFYKLLCSIEIVIESLLLFFMLSVSYDDLITLGSMNAVKEKGLLRSEGKEYVVQDGDLMNFLFNV